MDATADLLELPVWISNPNGPLDRDALWIWATYGSGAPPEQAEWIVGGRYFPARALTDAEYKRLRCKEAEYGQTR